MSTSSGAPSKRGSGGNVSSSRVQAPSTTILPPPQREEEHRHCALRLVREPFFKDVFGYFSAPMGEIDECLKWCLSAVFLCVAAIGLVHLLLAAVLLLRGEVDYPNRPKLLFAERFLELTGISWFLGLTTQHYYMTLGWLLLLFAIVSLVCIALDSQTGTLVILSSMLAFAFGFAFHIVFGSCLLYLLANFSKYVDMKTFMESYEPHRLLKGNPEILDYIQVGMKCCGIRGPEDFLTMNDTTLSALGGRGSVPASCCRFVGRSRGMIVLDDPHCGERALEMRREDWLAVLNPLGCDERAYEISTELLAFLVINLLIGGIFLILIINSLMVFLGQTFSIPAECLAMSSRDGLRPQRGQSERTDLEEGQRRSSPTRQVDGKRGGQVSKSVVLEDTSGKSAVTPAAERPQAVATTPSSPPQPTQAKKEGQLMRVGPELQGLLCDALRQLTGHRIHSITVNGRSCPPSTIELEDLGSESSQGTAHQTGLSQQWPMCPARKLTQQRRDVQEQRSADVSRKSWTVSQCEEDQQQRQNVFFPSSTSSSSGEGSRRPLSPTCPPTSSRGESERDGPVLVLKSSCGKVRSGRKGGLSRKKGSVSTSPPSSPRERSPSVSEPSCRHHTPDCPKSCERVEASSPRPRSSSGPADYHRCEVGEKPPSPRPVGPVNRGRRSCSPNGRGRTLKDRACTPNRRRTPSQERDDMGRVLDGRGRTTDRRACFQDDRPEETKSDDQYSNPPTPSLARPLQFTIDAHKSEAAAAGPAKAEIPRLPCAPRKKKPDEDALSNEGQKLERMSEVLVDSLETMSQFLKRCACPRQTGNLDIDELARECCARCKNNRDAPSDVDSSSEKKNARKSREDIVLTPAVAKMHVRSRPAVPPTPLSPLIDQVKQTSPHHAPDLTNYDRVVRPPQVQNISVSDLPLLSSTQSSQGSLPPVPPRLSPPPQKQPNDTLTRPAPQHMDPYRHQPPPHPPRSLVVPSLESPTTIVRRSPDMCPTSPPPSMEIPHLDPPPPMVPRRQQPPDAQTFMSHFKTSAERLFGSSSSFNSSGGEMGTMEPQPTSLDETNPFVSTFASSSGHPQYAASPFDFTTTDSSEAFPRPPSPGRSSEESLDKYSSMS